MLLHARTGGVFVYEVEHILVDIRGECLEFRVAENLALCLLACVLPKLFGQEREVLSDEASRESGGAPCGDHCCLDDERSRAAEGVPEKRVLARTRRQRNGGGERFSDRCRS